MQQFKYFFRQLSYKLIQVTIFQVSLRFVEGLQRKSWKKVTEIKKVKCFLYIGFAQYNFSNLVLPKLSINEITFCLQTRMPARKIIENSP